MKNLNPEEEIQTQSSESILEKKIESSDSVKFEKPRKSVHCQVIEPAEERVNCEVKNFAKKKVDCVIKSSAEKSVEAFPKKEDEKKIFNDDTTSKESGVNHPFKDKIFYRLDLSDNTCGNSKYNNCYKSSTMRTTPRVPERHDLNICSIPPSCVQYVPNNCAYKQSFSANQCCSPHPYIPPNYRWGCLHQPSVGYACVPLAAPPPHQQYSWDNLYCSYPAYGYEMQPVPVFEPPTTVERVNVENRYNCCGITCKKVQPAYLRRRPHLWNILTYSYRPVE